METCGKITVMFIILALAAAEQARLKASDSDVAAGPG